MNRISAPSALASRVTRLLRAAATWVRSFAVPQTIDRARGDGPPVRVVLHRGRKRLDGATVNHSFGVLHVILAEALRRVEIGARSVRSVLALGLGAGSLVHLLRREHGIAAPIVAVEVDNEVLRLARRHFDLDAWPALEIVCDDAAAFVAADRRAFDLVVVDVFEDGVVPEDCRGASFVAAVRARVAPGGLLLFNVMAERPTGRALLPHLAAAIRTHFEVVDAHAIHGNVVFAATATAPRANVASASSANQGSSASRWQ